MLSLDNVTDHRIHDEDSGKEEDPYDDNAYGEEGDEEDPYDRSDDDDDEDPYDRGGGSVDDDDDEDRSNGNNNEGGNRSDSDDSYNSDEEDKEDEEDEEEGVEVGLRGENAMQAAIELMHSGVHKIDLAKRDIRDEHAVALREELRNNESLTSLDLSKNYIREKGGIALAEALSNNKSLTTLSFASNHYRSRHSSNNIGPLGAAAFATALATNETLTSLDLTGNQIGNEGVLALVKVLVGRCSLENLNLENNEIGDDGAFRLAEALGRNNTLTSLNLSFNEISDEGGARLGEGLGKSKSLTELHLESNKIGDKGAAGLGEGLGKSKSLTELHLARNQIGDKGAAALGEGLGKSKSLTELHLAHNKIGDKGAAGIGEGLGKSKSLTRLFLNYNIFDASGAAGLGDGLSENDSLTCLNLQGNKIGNDGAMLLGKALEENTVLTELSLDDSGIGAAGGRALGEALSRNGTLTMFKLSSNPLGPEGGSAIGEALRTNITLTSLDIQACNLGDGGASTIAEALSQNENSALATLHLGGNDIGDDGAGALAKALEINTSLTSLKNVVSDIGFTQLAEMLYHNKNLRELDLSDNKPGDDGVFKLAEALSRNVGLHVLNLNDCKISDQGVAALGKSLAANSSLTRLDLENCDFGEKAADGLAEGLRENDSLTSLNIASHRYGKELDPKALEVLLRSILSENEGLFEVEGLPELPENFSWSYLLTTSKGKAQADRIRKYLFDVEAEKWTPAAHKLARKQAHVFQFFAFMVDQNDPEMQKFFSDPKLWLQTQGEDEDEKAEDEDKLPLIHALFDCHATTTIFALQKIFCTDIIAERLKLEDGLLLMKAEDGGGRTLRSLALTNRNTKRWAKTYGTYLGRYNVVEGPPVHESKTCAVHYATDIKTNKLVALKIMRDKHQYNREISAREVAGDGEDLLKGCMKLLDRDDPEFVARLDKERCLVMPQGSRSLFEAINTERFAGRDLPKIRAIAHKIALAIKNLHNSGRIHGDIKPRNVVRVNPSVQHTFSLENKGGSLEVPETWREDVTGELQSSRSDAIAEDWKLIDLDASASLLNDAQVTEKMLSGTKLFKVDESDDNLVHDQDKLKLINWLALDDERLQRIKRREDRTEIEGKIADVGNGLQEERRGDIEAARDLVRLCLRGDPSERITLTQILEEHLFFKSLREDASCTAQNDDVDPASSKVARKRSSRKYKRGRISLQLLGIHRHVDLKRFSLFGRTTTPKLPRNAKLSEFRAKEAYRELIDLPTYHFFLSHVQSQAAGIAKDLAYGLERHQLSAWVDMRAADITLEGMHRGILFSRCFLMVLTKDVFFRPYCLIELKYAVDYFRQTSGGLEEHIFFIVEEDQRFYPWTAEIKKPWDPEPWKVEDDDDMDENADDVEDDFDVCEGSVPESPRSERKDDGVPQLRDELGKLGFNEAEEVFDAAQHALSVCKRIPYRRREFEEDAMIRALDFHAGFQKSSPFSFTFKDSLSFTVVGKGGSNIARELVAKLKAKENIAASLFPSVARATSVLIVVLEQGCRDDVERALKEWALAELPILVVADDKTWNLDEAHKEEFSEEVQIRLFDHLEVLTWRPEKVKSDNLYIVDHEQPALIDELCSRAAKLARKSA